MSLPRRGLLATARVAALTALAAVAAGPNAPYERKVRFRAGVTISNSASPGTLGSPRPDELVVTPMPTNAAP